MDYLADALVIGLSEQGPLALAAMGLALIYYLSGIINVAYAETITLGAYFGMWANTALGLNFYGSIVVAATLAGGLSVATYLLVFRPAAHRHVGTLEVIIISFGLSVFLRHGLQFVFGYLDRFYDVPPPTYTSVLGVGVTTFQITAMALVIALGVGLYLFIQRTDPGQRIRALASDAQLAEVSGIDPRRVSVLIWFVAGVAGGLAGAFWGVASSARPDLGFSRILLILLVVVVAGGRHASSLWRVQIVGLAAGVLLSALTLRIDPLHAQIWLLVVFLVVLKARARQVIATGQV
jgi:branched-subunit amino acid ABC-type transport system permease component